MGVGFPAIIKAARGAIWGLFAALGCGGSMRVWQRYDYLYKTYGPRVFEIWISDDANAADGILEDWELVGTYAIVKAATDAEAMQEAIDGHEFWIYPADVDFTRQFQYLRFKCLDDFGSGTIGCLSELTLWCRGVTNGQFL